MNLFIPVRAGNSARRKYRLSVLLVCLSPGFPTGVFAAAPVEEVIVTADPLQRADDHLVQPVSVLRGDALARASVRNIGEAVSAQPGVTSGDFGANVGRPIIRGLGGARVRVLEDGIGTMDVSTLSPDHAVAIEPVFARQIEIFRGPATLLYGSGASGGLVNVVDTRIPIALPARPGGAAYGHYDAATDGWLGALSLDAGLGEHVAVHLEGTGADSEDYDIPDFAEVNPDPGEISGTLVNSASENGSYAGGMSLLGSRGFIGFSGGRLDRRYGVPGAHHHHEEGAGEEATEEGGVTIDQAQTRFDLKGELREPLPGLVALRTRWGINDHTHIELEPDGGIGTRLQNDEWEGRIEGVHARLGRFDGVIGVQLQDRRFDASGEEAFVPASEQDSVAVFVVEKADFGPVHADIGARFEHNEARDLVQGTQVDADLYALSGGLAWRYREGYETGVSVTRAERAPALEELFANGPHLATNTFEIGDAALDLEVSTNVDVYWRRTGTRWRLDLGFFYNDIADFVFAAEQDGNGDGVADRVEEDFADTGLVVDEEEALLLVRQEQRDARFWGFEFESRFLLLDDARGTLDWRLWTDYVEARLSNGERVPRVPPLRVGSGLEWTRGRVSADVDVMHVTGQARLAGLETPTDSHTVVNLGVAWTLPLPGEREVIWFARGTNLLDAEVRRHTSFVKDLAPLPGASGLVGVRVTF